jgi:hypothetical protein
LKHLTSPLGARSKFAACAEKAKGEAVQILGVERTREAVQIHGVNEREKRFSC